MCDTPWKFQDQKPRPMEILHNFFLNTPGNSTSFLIDPLNFHMLFLQYPQIFHVLNSPCLDFFWNSPLELQPFNLTNRMAVKNCCRKAFTRRQSLILRRQFCDYLKFAMIFLQRKFNFSKNAWHSRVKKTRKHKRNIIKKQKSHVACERTK